MLAWHHLAPSLLQMSVACVQGIKEERRQSIRAVVSAERRVVLKILIHCMQGAALTLLQQSYTSRDQVCVIPFCGDRAEVLLPPIQVHRHGPQAYGLPALRRGVPPGAWHLPGARHACRQTRHWQRLDALTCESPEGRMVPVYSGTI